MLQHVTFTELVAYERRELSQESETKILEHLNDCPHCAQTAEFVSSLVSNLPEAPAHSYMLEESSLEDDCLSTDDIITFMTGELPFAAARRIERHLATCERCRQKLADLIRASAPFARSELTAAAKKSTLDVEQQLRAVERMLFQAQPPPKHKQSSSPFSNLLTAFFPLQPARVALLLVLIAGGWFGQMPLRHWQAARNVEEGVALLQETYRIPDDAMRPYGFGSSMFSEHHSTKRPTEVEKKLRAALFWEGKNRQAKRALGLLYYFEQDEAQADSLLRDLIMEDDEDYAAWNDLGFIAAYREDTLAALQAFERALALHPGCEEAAHNRALLLGDK